MATLTVLAYGLCDGCPSNKRGTVFCKLIPHKRAMHHASLPASWLATSIQSEAVYVKLMPVQLTIDLLSELLV